MRFDLLERDLFLASWYRLGHKIEGMDDDD